MSHPGDSDAGGLRMCWESLKSELRFTRLLMASNNWLLGIWKVKTQGWVGYRSTPRRSGGQDTK